MAPNHTSWKTGEESVSLCIETCQGSWESSLETLDHVFLRLLTYTASDGLKQCIHFSIFLSNWRDKLFVPFIHWDPYNGSHLEISLSLFWLQASQTSQKQLEQLQTLPQQKNHMDQQGREWGWALNFGGGLSYLSRATLHWKPPGIKPATQSSLCKSPPFFILQEVPST